jgi:hypothetical protein
MQSLLELPTEIGIWTFFCKKNDNNKRKFLFKIVHLVSSRNFLWVGLWFIIWLSTLVCMFFCVPGCGAAIITCATSFRGVRFNCHRSRDCRASLFIFISVLTKRYLSQVIYHRCATNLAHKKGVWFRCEFQNETFDNILCFSSPLLKAILLLESTNSTSAS